MKRHCVPCETGCGQTDWNCPWCGRFTTPGEMPSRLMLHITDVQSDSHANFHPTYTTGGTAAVTMAELFDQ